MKPTWKWMRAAAADEMADVVKALPGEVGRRVEAVPILFKKRPGRLIVAEGIGNDTMGVFVGASLLDGPEAIVLPARIILFLENIWNAAGGREGSFRKELRKTLLHEIGHFLGWEEPDLEARQLD